MSLIPNSIEPHRQLPNLTPPRIQTPDLGNPFLIASPSPSWNLSSSASTGNHHVKTSLHQIISNTHPSTSPNHSTLPVLPRTNLNAALPLLTTTTTRPSTSKLELTEHRHHPPSSSTPLQPNLISHSPHHHPTATSTQPFPSVHPPSLLKHIPPDTPPAQAPSIPHSSTQIAPPDPSSTDHAPSSPVSPNMTPAQKIAREVRRSFSLAQAPTPIPVGYQNSVVERPSNQPSPLGQPPHPSPLVVPPSESDPSSQGLTPAQAVAHQARLMASTLPNTTSSDPTSTAISSIPLTPNPIHSNPSLAPLNHTPSEPPPSTSKLKLKKSPSKPDPKLSLTSSAVNTTPEPPFRVISGRKGHPGDGKDKTAVARLLDHGLNSEKPIEPKVVKTGSSVLSKLSLHASGSHPPLPSSPKATLFPGSTGTLPSVQVVEPSPSPIRPGTTTLAPLPVSPSPLAPLTLSSGSANSPLIPLAVFPTYNNHEEDETASTDFTDQDGMDEEEESEEEEEEDYDSNPLYIVLSTSPSPRLKDAYDSAKLVLLPTRRALPLDMPRKLPDPSLEFESEWEQWIAAHTFVAAGTEPGGSVPKEVGKGTVEWVGFCKSGDRRVNLSLKPGTGIAEVRLTMVRPGPPPTALPKQPPPLTSGPATKNLDPDFSPSAVPRPASELDPHRTIRAKPVENHQPALADAHHPPVPVSNRFSKSSAITTSDLTHPSCSSSVPRSDILRSPSTATESSMAFTQTSSAVSRTSSEGWSDIPTTPPPLLHVLSDSQPSPQAPPLLPMLETVTRVHHAKIISEETMYRSPPRQPLQATPTQSPPTPPPTVVLESALSGSKAKKGKEVEQRLRFKAPKWLRPGAAQKEKEKEKERKEKALALARERERERLRLLEGEGGGGLERVRLISLKGPVIARWWQKEETEMDQEIQDKSVPFPTTLARTPTPASPGSSLCLSLSRKSTYSSSLRMARRSSSKDSENTKKESSCGGSSRRRSRRMPSGLSILRHGTGSTRPRNLLNDLSFLLSPPDEFGEVSGVLKRWVGRMWGMANSFNQSFGYLKGFENYLLMQLKKDLFQPVCDGLREDLRQNGNETVVRWVNEDWDRFGSLIENVLMAFLHPSIYTRGVATQFTGEDDYLDTILHNYRKRAIALSEFEIELPMGLQDESLLTEAIEKLNQLRPFDGIASGPSPLGPEVLQRLFVAMDTSEEQTVLRVLMAKTPLESIGIIKQTIDSLVTAWTELASQAGLDEEARRLTPDDLLALLACVIVRSGVEQQHSMINYAKVFRLGATLTPETDWAFVTYQAAIAYLQSDPFSAVDSRSVNSQPVSVSSLPSSPSLGPGWTRRRPASFTPRTRSIPTGPGSSTLMSSAVSSPSASSVRLPSTDELRHSGTLRVTPRPRPSRPLLVGGSGRTAEAPRHLAGKVPPTRPTLAPISTTDRCTRRSLDLGMLSTPGVADSRACSNGWESVRSLSSIGESDPPNSRVFFNGGGGPSRSFHFPYSAEFHPTHHHSLSLERRKTNDWTDEPRAEGWIEWGRKRLTSVTSLQVMGGSGNGNHIERNGFNGGMSSSLTPAMAALAKAKAQSTTTKVGGGAQDEEQEVENDERLKENLEQKKVQVQKHPDRVSTEWRTRPKSVIGLSTS